MKASRLQAASTVHGSRYDDCDTTFETVAGCSPDGLHIVWSNAADRVLFHDVLYCYPRFGP